MQGRSTARSTSPKSLAMHDALYCIEGTAGCLQVVARVTDTRGKTMRCQARAIRRVEQMAQVGESIPCSTTEFRLQTTFGRWYRWG
jgi:hypothetical protein